MKENEVKKIVGSALCFAENIDYDVNRIELDTVAIDMIYNGDGEIEVVKVYCKNENGEYEVSDFKRSEL